MKTFQCGHANTPKNRRSNGVRNGVRSYRCKTCKRAANSQYQKDNPDKVSERNRRVREKYPEKERQRVKEWNEKVGKQYMADYMRNRRRARGTAEWGSPECKEKMSKAALKRIERDGVPYSPRSSKLELDCIPMFAKRGYKHTGSGDFWIKGKDGRIKNPDFFNKKSKSVIEVWGDYWHRGQDPKDLIAWYKQNGFRCEIYWETDLKAKIY